MSYTKTIWINDGEPAINAVRLNNIETGVHTAVLHAESSHAPASAEVNDPNTTLEGNTFNGNNQLVKLESDGKLPAIDGSQLVGVPGTLNQRATDILITNNGFSRHDMESLGITEFCFDSASGIVHQFKSVNGVTVFTELTSQTFFAAGTAYQTAIASKTSVIYPHENKSTYDYYINNNKYEINTLDSVQFTPSGSGTYWAYYSSDTGLLTFVNSTSEDIIEDCAIVMIVYYNATEDTFLLCANEQHGIEWAGSLHAYNHNNFGALYTSGLAIQGLIEGTGAYTSIDSGWIADEDIDNFSFLQDVSPFWYKDGIDGDWLPGDIDLNLCMIGTLYSQYNEWTGATWQLSDIGNNNYTLVHMLRTNDGKYPMVKIVGEQVYSTSVLARAGAQEEIQSINLNGLPTPEIVNCYTMIVDSDGNLVANADGSLYIDWRGSSSTGTSGGDNSTGSDLHADLVDTHTNGHPTSAITYDTTVTFEGLHDYGSVTASQLIDLRASQYQKITVNANINLNFTPPIGPATVYLHIYQGNTGGLVTFPPAKWPSGEVGVVTPLAGSGHDLLMVHYDGTEYVLALMQDLIVG